MAIFFALLLTCGWSAERFDWAHVLQLPPQAHLVSGSQVMHFKSVDRHYEQSASAKRFVEEHLQNAVVLTSDAEVLRFGSDSVKEKGLFLELGVCTGKTINFIAALNPHQQIYGFDSFEGLPEAWVRDDKVFPAGTFGFKDPSLLPPVLHNVQLIQGLFNDTLVAFVKAMGPEEKIAFLHIDCDLYSSTHTAFEALGPKIGPGTIIVFDELYNYPGCERHEWRAFQEFLSASGFGVKYLAFNMYHEQVVVEIKGGS